MDPPFYIYSTFIQLDFIFIVYILYNKYIILLPYVDHDCKYPNSSILVDDSYERYGQHS